MSLYRLLSPENTFDVQYQTAENLKRHCDNTGIYEKYMRAVFSQLGAS
jgi:hypothetical protein